MAFDTIIQQGRFTSDGTAQDLVIRSDFDWIEIYNETAIKQTTADLGVKYYFQRGMTEGTGIITTKLGTVTNDPLNIGQVSSGGFNFVNTSGDPVGAINSTITAISTAATPVVSLSSTSGLATGDVVRLINVSGAQQLGGIDFTIGSLVANTSFTLAYMAQLGGAGTTGSLRKISFDPIYYPRRRFISKITKAASAVVTLTVTHGFTAGQKVRFQVPDDYGMTEINNITGTVTAISTVNNTVTVDIDSTGFTTFAFPATAGVPFTPAQLIPVGEAAEESYVNLLDDATDNQAYIGVKLGLGAAGDGTNGPAGQSSDVIYWRAGKSFSVSNS